MEGVHQDVATALFPTYYGSGENKFGWKTGEFANRRRAQKTVFAKTETYTANGTSAIGG
jgi:hypothetical protein